MISKKEIILINVKIQIPDQVFVALNENTEELSKQMKLYTAMEMYKKHKLTLKQAADLADCSIPSFFHELNIHEIDIIDYDPDELEMEMEIFKEC